MSLSPSPVALVNDTAEPSPCVLLAHRIVLSKGRISPDGGDLVDNTNTELHLQMIDQIRARIPVTYEAASNALDKTGGSLIDALALLENECVIEEPASERWQKVESLISGWIDKGRATRLLVKQNQEVVAQVPVSAGIVGALLAPKLTLLGAVAALAGGCRLELEPIPSASDVTDLLDEINVSDARVAAEDPNVLLH